MFLLNRDTLINTVLLEVDKVTENFKNMQSSDEKINALVECNQIMETMRLVDLGQHYDEISGLCEDYFVKFATEFVGLLDKNEVFSKYPIITGTLLPDQEISGITRANKFVKLRLQHHHYMRDPRETSDIKNIVYITDFDFQEEWHSHPNDNSTFQMLLKRTEMEKFTWIFDNNENIISTKAPHLYHNPKIIGTCLIKREPGLTDDDYLNMSKTDAKTYNAYIHGQVYKLTTEDLHSNEIEEFIVYGKDDLLKCMNFEN